MRKVIGTASPTSNPISRRTLLARMAVAGLGASALGLAATVEAAENPQQPEAETGSSYTMAAPDAQTEEQFRVGVMGPAMLSLAASKIAVDKATDPDTKEFANFELREAIAVTTVLESLDTPVPPMNAEARATLAKIESTPKSAEFDTVYITAQLANHEFLRDLAESYLLNAAGKDSAAEMHGQHLATLALSTFKEHVVHCKTISQALQG